MSNNQLVLEYQEGLVLGVSVGISVRGLVLEYQEGLVLEYQEGLVLELVLELVLGITAIVSTQWCWTQMFKLLNQGRVMEEAEKSLMHHVLKDKVIVIISSSFLYILKEASRIIQTEKSEIRIIPPLI